MEVWDIEFMTDNSVKMDCENNKFLKVMKMNENCVTTKGQPHKIHNLYIETYFFNEFMYVKYNWMGNGQLRFLNTPTKSAN